MGSLVRGYFSLCFATLCVGQLIVNVKNKGGEVMRQSIMSNTTQDSVTLEFQKSDGTLITQYIDFKSDVQVFRVMVLGEEELGDAQFQVLCFITRFIKNEFISSDAMSKLRQKNPSAVRHPEDDKGTEMFTMDLSVDHDHAHVLSPIVKTMCHDATETTYAKDTDIKVLSRTLNKDYNVMMQSAKMTDTENVARCHTLSYSDMTQSCMCRMEICVGWYPCGLKYCHGKDSTGKVVSYRCGIKTCKKCRVFDYHVKTKRLCMWDTPEQ